ncbi:8013_t:CDS:1 [Ambispora leptoticha]|uniref:assimilatory sulfite reductase (NADPH) n=1 Tax=Ambispora leptoticha TaxID=144679 RepID=A0A9N8VDT3_9GLOM|nr:8013_t:CDS:1 [Ambispora leptoticha]
MTTPYSSLIIGWRLQGRHVLIVGGNQVAANRLDFALSAKPAKITLVYPKQKITCPKLLECIEKKGGSGLFTFIDKEFNIEILDSAPAVDLVLTAANDAQLSQKIVAATRERRIPVNVAEIPQLCDFLFMPTYRDEYLQVAISTNNFVARNIDKKKGDLALVTRKIREHVLNHVPSHKDIIAASNNLALLRKNLDESGGNMSSLSKIIDPLPLEQLAQLSAKDIAALTNENHNSLLSEGTFSDIDEASSTFSSDEKQSDITFVEQANDSYSDNIEDRSLIKSNIIDNERLGGDRLVDGKNILIDVEIQPWIKSKVNDKVLIGRLGGNQLVDGKTALAYVAYALSTNAFIYPTTRSAYIGKVIEHWCANNVRNAFGKVGQVEKMDTRVGTATTILGAATMMAAFSSPLKNKDFNLSSYWHFSAFATSQTIVNMIPNLYILSVQHIPLVIHVAAQGQDHEMNNTINYHDALQARDTGVSMINSFTVQETHDVALIAHLVSALTESPFLHIFDGIKITHELTKADLLSYDDIAKLWIEIKTEANTLKQQRNSHNSIIDAIETVAIKVGQKLGRHYRLFEYIGAHDAESVLVVLGDEVVSVRETVNRLSQYGGKVGAIVVRVYRPWSVRHFLNILPKTTKRIAVFEQVVNTKKGSIRNSSTLFTDISASFQSEIWVIRKTPTPIIVDVKYPITQILNARKIKLALHQLVSGVNIDLNADLLSAIDIPPPSHSLKQCIFWDSEPLGTVHTSAHIANVFTNIPQLNFSSLSTYDVYNNGGVAATRLRFGPDRICGVYDGECGADYIGIHDANLISKYDILHAAKERTMVLLNTEWETSELAMKLSNDFKHEAATRNIQLFVIDAQKIVRDMGLSTSSSTDAINIVLQTAFLRLNSYANLDESLQEAIADHYDGVSEKEVTRIVRDIVEKTQDGLVRIDIPSMIWSQLEKSNQNIPCNIENNSFSPNLDKPSIQKRAKLDSWHRIALNLLFKEAYGQKQKTRPDLSEKTFIVNVSENRRLTPLTYERNLFHVEFDINENDKFTYNIGEALGVYGHNDPDEVNQFLQYYGLEPNDVILVPSKEGNQYEARTVLQLFTQVLDIFGRPPKRFYESLAKYAKNETEKNKLLWIASSDGLEEFKRRVDDTTTFADIFYEFQSARPPAEDLVNLITPIKPRHYSIASSNNVHPNQVHLLIVTVEWLNSIGKKRYGQCTRYLSKLKVGEKVTVSIKSSVMKLPPLDSQPIILAGLGTGMAPFRAFIEERAYRKSKGKKVGPIILYFGSRNRAMEYLYGEELEAYHAEGVLTHLRLAFSRDQPKKVYIQHKMQEDAQLLYEYLLKKEGWFYLCGPTWPVPDVRDAITDGFVKAGRLSKREANDWVNRLKDLERYILEVY